MARRTNENNVQEVKPAMGQQVPVVANVIPSNGSWSGDNQLGIEVDFAPDANARQTILKLNEWGPPEEWTISLFLRDQNINYSALGIKAIIEFGVGGSTQTVEVDWNHGVEITKTMNAVNVIAVFDSIGGYSDEGVGLRLGVQLARGTRGGDLPPKLTIEENVVIASGSFSNIFRVPAFASAISFVPYGAAADIGRAYSDDFTMIQAKASDGSGAVIAGLRGSDIRLGQMMPVIKGANSFYFSNQTAGTVQISVYALIQG